MDKVVQCEFHLRSNRRTVANKACVPASVRILKFASRGGSKQNKQTYKNKEEKSCMLPCNGMREQLDFAGSSVDLVLAPGMLLVFALIFHLHINENYFFHFSVHGTYIYVCACVHFQSFCSSNILYCSVLFYLCCFMFFRVMGVFSQVLFQLKKPLKAHMYSYIHR